VLERSMFSIHLVVSERENRRWWKQSIHETTLTNTDVFSVIFPSTPVPRARTFRALERCV